MDNGLPVTPAASMARNLLRVADFLPFGYGFAIVSMLVRRDYKRLGDIAAATIVVHDRARSPRIVLARSSARRAGAAADAGGSGGGHRARGARAAAHDRAARRTGRARRGGVRRCGPCGPRGDRRVLGVAQWVLGRRS